MFKQPTIVIAALVLLAAVGVGIGVFSLRHRRKIRRLCNEADQAIKQNRHDDALQLLLAAERDWGFNSHDGSRSSHLNDLDDFITIVN